MNYTHAGTNLLGGNGNRQIMTKYNNLRNNKTDNSLVLQHLNGFSNICF